MATVYYNKLFPIILDYCPPQPSGLLNFCCIVFLLLCSKVNISGQFCRLWAGYAVNTYWLLIFIDFLILPSHAIIYSGSIVCVKKKKKVAVCQKSHLLFPSQWHLWNIDPLTFRISLLVHAWYPFCRSNCIKACF